MALALKRLKEQYAAIEKQLDSVTVTNPADELKARIDATPRLKSYHSFGLFLSDVRRQNVDTDARERLKAYEAEYRANVPEYVKKAFPSGMNETVLADGGALVPPQFVNEVLMRVYEDDLLSRVRLFNQLTGNQLKIPAVNETSRANGSRFGGLTSYWRQEGPPSAITASKPGLKLIDLTVEPISVLVRTTVELLEDYVALESLIGEMVAQEFQFRLGDAVVNGDGVGKPLGIMNSGSKLAVTKVAGQAAATVVAQNLYDMYARLWKGCRKNAVWLIANTVWPQLMGMTSGNFPIFLQNNTIFAEPMPSILNRPVIETEFNQVLGTEGDIILFDPTTYLFASKGDMRSFSSMHVYFDTAEHAFRFDMRVDGKSWWNSKLTQYKGASNYVSNIVTLETRA